MNLGSDGRTYSTETLLRRADVQTLQVTGDVAFHRTMHYRVVTLNALLGGIGKKDHLQFVARDGFAAEIPASLLLGTKGSEAWLAIEDPAHPWPALPDHHGSAGPFYVVWSNPQAAGIGPEQWPYQLASIRRLGDVESRFPAMLPDRAVPAVSPIRRGFAVFQQTCLACHTINGAGDAQLGPDLNLPHNPTEYLRADLLRAYIRDPQSLRPLAAGENARLQPRSPAGCRPGCVVGVSAPHGRSQGKALRRELPPACRTAPCSGWFSGVPM